ncbi:MAG: hypothetical protein CM15mP128_1120 [Methanobacteriota archaeon]|nr:MAG: hypothetical protein CM15mP128_1120 [Euryarchaeota archaeon]
MSGRGPSFSVKDLKVQRRGVWSLKASIWASMGASLWFCQRGKRGREVGRCS